MPPHTPPTHPRSATDVASRIVLSLLSLVLPLSAATPAESEWPQWRGPLANGVAPKATPPLAWSETQNVKWKVQIPGSGTGTPLIWRQQIFIQTAVPTGKKVEPPPVPTPKSAAVITPQVFGQLPPPPPAGGTPPPRGPRGGRPGGGGGRAEAPSEFYRFNLLALDRATGKVQWEKTLNEVVPHEGHHRDHGYASHSPITDGQHIWSWFGSRGLHCLDMKGAVLWSKDLGKMKTRAGFGEGNSPALQGNTLVVNWDHEGTDFIAAFDKSTGRELWRQPREEDTTWTTPLIVNYKDQYQVIVAATRRVRSYDLSTGKPLWECGGMTANVIPTPVSDFELVYAISGFRGASLLALKLDGTGDLTDTASVVWKHTKATPYVPSPILYGERLYFLSGNNAILSALNAKTGQSLITEERLEGVSGVYASPVGAAGRVYFVGRNGTTVVIKDSDKLEVLATNTLDEKFDASPALAGKDLLLRGQRFLYCLAQP